MSDTDATRLSAKYLHLGDIASELLAGKPGGWMDVVKPLTTEGIRKSPTEYSGYFRETRHKCQTKAEESGMLRAPKTIDLMATVSAYFGEYF